MKRNFQMVGMILSAVVVSLACNLAIAGVAPETATIITPIALGTAQTGLNVRPASEDTPATNWEDEGSKGTQVVFILTQTENIKQSELPTKTVANDNQPLRTKQKNK